VVGERKKKRAHVEAGDRKEVKPGEAGGANRADYAHKALTVLGAGEEEEEPEVVVSRKRRSRGNGGQIRQNPKTLSCLQGKWRKRKKKKKQYTHQRGGVCHTWV